MFQSILVGTDFSEDAARALTVTCRWADALAADVTLVHVRTPLGDLDLDPPMLASLAAYQEMLAERVRAQLDALVVPPALRAQRVSLVAESAAAGLVAHAGVCGADLIAVGSHGRGALARLLTGSVADRVTRMASCPVLVVPPSESAGEAKGRAVIAPVDFSGGSRAGASVAASLARALGLRLVLLHVVDPTGHPAFYISDKHSVSEAFPNLKARCRHKMGELLATLGPDSHTEIVVAEGREHVKIAEIAAEHGAEAVVMSSKGLGGGVAGMLGSITAKVLGTARCPVLVVGA